MSKSQNKERTDEDLEEFEEQPFGTKELQRLKHLAEKSTGMERAELDKKISRQSWGEKTP